MTTEPKWISLEMRDACEQFGYVRLDGTIADPPRYRATYIGGGISVTLTADEPFTSNWIKVALDDSSAALVRGATA